MTVIDKYQRWLTPERRALGNDLGLLVLRLGIGLNMALGHGLGKIIKLFGEGPIRFADPIGLGAPVSLFLAGSAEFFCAIFVAVGFATRFAAIPVAFTMAVAAFIVHASDPWKKMEFAVIYLIPFVALVLTGPGRFSIDHTIARRSRA